jgi:hypothetical protein
MTRLPMMAGTCSMESEHYGLFFIRLGESFGSGKSTTSFRSRKEGRILEISVLKILVW